MHNFLCVEFLSFWTFCPLALEKYVYVSNPTSNEKKGGEEGEEKEKEEELKIFAKIKKLNQYISTSPDSTTCRNTYNNWKDA